VTCLVRDGAATVGDGSQNLGLSNSEPNGDETSPIQQKVRLSNLSRCPNRKCSSTLQRAVKDLRMNREASKGGLYFRERDSIRFALTPDVKECFPNAVLCLAMDNSSSVAGGTIGSQSDHTKFGKRNIKIGILEGDRHNYFLKAAEPDIPRRDS
jgi:hypothetical protein